MIEVPKIQDNASADIKCHLAKKELMEPLGLPWERPKDWKEMAIAKLDELRKKNRALQDYLDICVRCGACADKCHYFLGTGDPKNMPVARAELLRKVYRKHFTISGKLFGKFVGAEDLTEEVLNDWYTYFYQCSQCRRCAVFCPYGIDTATITTAAREIMNSIGMGTKYLTEVLNKVHQIGNNLGIPEAAWKANSEFFEGELKEETGLDIKLPADKKDADILFVPPSADLFVNSDTMMGYGKVFHAVGANWTTSSYASEAGNFGLFFSYEQMKIANKRVVDIAKKWGVKKIIVGECGHAWRVLKNYTETLNGPLDIPIQHICEYTADLIKNGELKLDPSKNDEKKIDIEEGEEKTIKMSYTFHDPCNAARGGDIIEEPRYILNHVVNDFREMENVKENTFCCGAGGGLLTDEIMELRLKGGKPRAVEVKETGVKYLATICAICKAQLPEVMKHYKIDVQVGGLHELVGNAIIFE